MTGAAYPLNYAEIVVRDSGLIFFLTTETKYSIVDLLIVSIS